LTGREPRKPDTRSGVAPLAGRDLRVQMPIRDKGFTPKAFSDQPSVVSRKHGDPPATDGWPLTATRAWNIRPPRAS